MGLTADFNRESADNRENEVRWTQGHSLTAGSIALSTAEHAEKLPVKMLETPLRGVSKFAPVAGVGLTVHSALAEIEENLKQGRKGKALSAGVAGAAEVIGGFAGFGVGDIMREATRGAIGAVFGQEYMPDKSGLREMGALGCDAIVAAAEKSQRETRADIYAQQCALIDKDPSLPKTVALPDGQEISFAQALKDPKFHASFRTALAMSPLDCSQQVATLDRFAELESANNAATGRLLPARRKSPAPGGKNA